MKNAAQRTRGIAAAAMLLVAGCGGPPPPDQARTPMPPAAAALLEQAREAYDRGALAPALALLDSTAAAAPARAEVYFLQGLLYRDMNRFDEARQAFEEVLALYPSYRSVRYNLGQTAFLGSAYREALRWYREEERVLRRSARTESSGEKAGTALAVVLAQIGRSFAQLGVADSARLAYGAALRADSANASAHAWLAEIDRDAGAFDSALTHARAALALAPENPEFHVLLGTTLLRSGNADEALPALREATRRQPWNREAVYNLGRALMSLGRPDEATVYLGRADTLEVLWGELGLILRSIQLHPGDAARWEEYAFLLNQAGHRTEAWKAINVARYLRLASPPADSTSQRNI